MVNRVRLPQRGAKTENFCPPPTSPLSASSVSDPPLPLLLFTPVLRLNALRHQASRDCRQAINKKRKTAFRERKGGKKKNTLRQMSTNSNSAKPWNPSSSPSCPSHSVQTSVCFVKKKKISDARAFILTLLVIMS